MGVAIYPLILSNKKNTNMRNMHFKGKHGEMTQPKVQIGHSFVVMSE
jgi:hypothetical protein